jgi:hypothetical protein
MVRLYVAVKKRQVRFTTNYLYYKSHFISGNESFTFIFVKSFTHTHPFPDYYIYNKNTSSFTNTTYTLEGRSKK